MAKDLNDCKFIGRLGKDPIVRYTPSGSAVANFSIATSDDYKDKSSGEKVEQTNWIPIVAFGRLAEIIGEYVKKGSQVYISGMFKTRKWQDQSGNDRYTTEIVASTMQMLGGKSDSSASRPQQQSNNTPHAQQNSGAGGGQAQNGDGGDFDDDIPFAKLSNKLY